MPPRCHAVGSLTVYGAGFPERSPRLHWRGDPAKEVPSPTPNIAAGRGGDTSSSSPRATSVVAGTTKVSIFTDRPRSTRAAARKSVSLPPVQEPRYARSSLVPRTSPKPKYIGTFEGQKCTGDPAVEANWQTVIIATKASKIDYTGLTPGQLTYFRVRGINGHPGAWSDIAWLIVL